MNKIKILNKGLINLVAAGEIVERPSSVVKELVENSIDAGATSIKIEIQNGGKSLICVCDNGVGINRDDVRSAFLSHATSKIYKKSDLEKIVTLGFRGEALASICAVSKLEMITLTDGELVGTKYKIEGGQEFSLTDCPSSRGTSILIRDLFYNIPARIKFMKKDLVEGNFVSAVVDRLVLSHPEISFQFFKNSKLVLSTPGDNKISSAVLRVFGKDFFKELIKIEYVSKNISINGFISKPEEARCNSRMQYFFVNGRYVKNNIISSAIEESFQAEMVSKKVPACVIYLKILPETVDVNIHPSKIEIRFENEKTIFQEVYNAVRSSLMTHRKSFFNFSFRPTEKPNTNINRTLLRDIVVSPALYDEKNLNIFKNNYNSKHSSPNFKRETKNISIENMDIKIIGEIFECFILVQYVDELILIDKHAAHEEIIFEKLSSNIDLAHSQTLVSSIVVMLERTEYDTFIENIELINNIGYQAEDFGNSKILIRGIPMFLEICDIKDSVIKIASFVLKNKINLKIHNLKKFYAKIACKSAIKAGRSSSYEEIKFLINNFMKIKKTCPHGRPIFISIKKNEINRRFNRNN
ncbi:MAG: DNA mismatch repair endonuclease MutL [Firmicutes bacterium]|nr:DNA mismatch repair endonuclease MutL [Bacillota bacterium]